MFWADGLCLLLEGIVICQVNNYYSWYPQDSIALKLSVAGLFILTLLKTIQALQVDAITWINSVSYMRDPDGTTALQREWYQLVNIPLLEVEREVVVNRASHLGHDIGPDLSNYQETVIGKTSGHGSTNWSTDILINLSSTYFLAKARKDAVSHMRRMLGRLIKICCQTALPATTAALCGSFKKLGNMAKLNSSQTQIERVGNDFLYHSKREVLEERLEQTEHIGCPDAVSGLIPEHGAMQ
ncbi:hypothetical protein DFH09DRAFT_1079251 [Mycena vulgaris]|nr:hypothetical protein DFH09DRAFT_1079251 [Mycena vulgaris]